MTAVEWLVEMICTDVDMYDEEDNEKVEYWNAFQSCTDLSEYINKAKEMEKQQIIDSWENGYREFYDGSSTPEEYYNKTFKNTNKCGQSEM